VAPGRRRSARPRHRRAVRRVAGEAGGRLVKRVVRVPRDAAALSLGADETAAALVAGAQAAGHEIELVRTGSRGICWLEPRVEVETGAGSVAYGPVDAQDVPALRAAGMLDGGSHPLRRGPVAAIPWFASQQRVT